MKKTITFLLIFIYTVGDSQVIKQHVAEHFTNTSCSVCASNNHIIYAAVDAANYTNHISFHPSSPYINDFFNLQNKQENDDRTNFYGIYGATPKVIFDGVYVTNYNNLGNIISAVDGIELSNFEITAIATQNAGQNEIAVKIKKVAADTLSSAILFAGLTEDSIFQVTNNGEAIHYNVFRKSLSLTAGNTIVLPQNTGDEINYNFQVVFDSGWIVNRLSALAILQRTDKSIINSAYSNKFQSATTGLNMLNKNKIKLFPNPATGFINVILEKDSKYEIVDLSGRIIMSGELKKNEPLNIEKLVAGMYCLNLYSGENYYLPFIKE